VQEKRERDPAARRATTRRTRAPCVHDGDRSNKPGATAIAAGKNLRKRRHHRARGSESARTSLANAGGEHVPSADRKHVCHPTTEHRGCCGVYELKSARSGAPSFRLPAASGGAGRDPAPRLVRERGLVDRTRPGVRATQTRAGVAGTGSRDVPMGCLTTSSPSPRAADTRNLATMPRA